MRSAWFSVATRRHGHFCKLSGSEVGAFVVRSCRYCDQVGEEDAEGVGCNQLWLQSEIRGLALSLNAFVTVLHVALPMRWCMFFWMDAAYLVGFVAHAVVADNMQRSEIIDSSVGTRGEPLVEHYLSNTGMTSKVGSNAANSSSRMKLDKSCRR